MSNDNRIYLGAYAKAKKTYEKIPKQVSYTACTNKECKQFDKQTNVSFCPSCGENIKTVIKEEFETIESYDRLNDWLYEGEGEDKIMRLALPSESKEFDYIISNEGQGQLEYWNAKGWDSPEKEINQINEEIIQTAIYDLKTYFVENKIQEELLKHYTEIVYEFGMLQDPEY